MFDRKLGIWTFQRKCSQAFSDKSCLKVCRSSNPHEFQTRQFWWLITSFLGLPIEWFYFFKPEASIWTGQCKWKAWIGVWFNSTASIRKGMLGRARWYSAGQRNEMLWLKKQEIHSLQAKTICPSMYFMGFENTTIFSIPAYVHLCERKNMLLLIYHPPLSWNCGKIYWFTISDSHKQSFFDLIKKPFYINFAVHWDFGTG